MCKYTKHVLRYFHDPNRLKYCKFNKFASYSFILPYQKYLESFEMWCWRRMEKISWTDHVRNEEVLFRVNEQRNILH